MLSSMVNSFLIYALRATFLGLPASRRRCQNSLSTGLRRLATNDPMCSADPPWLYHPTHCASLYEAQCLD